MKPKSPKSPNERYKDAITRSIDEKIKRLEARARPRAGENGDTAVARAKWLQLKAELTELEVRRRRNELVGFTWWQPVFDLLDPNDEVVKTRFTHIQVRHALSKLRQRRGS